MTQHCQNELGCSYCVVIVAISNSAGIHQPFAGLLLLLMWLLWAAGSRDVHGCYERAQTSHIDLTHGCYVTAQTSHIDC
jgi:hypothetical protein